MSAGDMLLGGAIGYSLGSSSGTTTVRKVKRSREDQIAIVVNLPIDEVGVKFANIFDCGVITNVDENDEYGENNSRRCLIGYDAHSKVFKFGEVRDKFGDGGFFSSKVIGKEMVLSYKYCYAKLTKLSENKTILTLKVYTSDGYRRFDEDDLILIFEKFKDFINSDEEKVL